MVTEMLNETNKFKHLWNLYDDCAFAIRCDLNSVRMPKLYSGAPKTVLGDVDLQSAILKAEEILAHLKAAETRRDDWIDMHKNKSFWLDETQN